MVEKISVVVPIYKVELYLERCVKSLVTQTYKNIEIILVDDGSPDNCPQICDIWAQRDNRILVIHKTNGGLSSARNAGIDAASGDYIAFVDSDDYIAPNMLEIMLNAIINNNVMLACCGRIRVTPSNQIKMFTLPAETVLSGKEAIKQILIDGFVNEAAWDKLYNKKLFNNRRFPVGEINEDIVQTIEILGENDAIVHVGQALYYYCENQDSITQSQYFPGKKIVIKHLDQIKLYLNKHYPDLRVYYNILETRYCQELLYLLLDSRNILQRYQQDYIEIYRRFKKVFLQSVKGGYIKKSEMIKGYLIYYKLYFLFHKLKKGFK